MAIPQIPDLLRAVLAHSADVEAIPDTTPTGQGVFSYRDGWPVITEVELEAGGIAPDRKFFNEINRLLSAHTFFSQSGNVYPWVGASESFPGLNYLRGAHVLGSDYQEYVAKKPSGPEIPAEGGGFVGPVNPVGDETEVWMPVFNISTVEKNGINRPDGVTTEISSEGIFSTIRASNAEVLAGLDSNKALTSAVLVGGFPSLLGLNGWQRLPSGLILQWGRFQTSSAGYIPLVFPVAFPNKLLSISGTVMGSATISQNAISTVFFQSSEGKTSVPCAAYVNTSNTFFVCGVYWVAIGY